MTTREEDIAMHDLGVNRAQPWPPRPPPTKVEPWCHFFLRVLAPIFALVPPLVSFGITVHYVKITEIKGKRMGDWHSPGWIMSLITIIFTVLYTSYTIWHRNTKDKKQKRLIFRLGLFLVIVSALALALNVVFTILQAVLKKSCWWEDLEECKWHHKGADEPAVTIPSVLTIGIDAWCLALDSTLLYQYRKFVSLPPAPPTAAPEPQPEEPMFNPFWALPGVPLTDAQEIGHPTFQKTKDKGKTNNTPSLRPEPSTLTTSTADSRTPLTREV